MDRTSAAGEALSDDQISLLLSRPLLSPSAQYHRDVAAFLAEDCDQFSVGMSGLIMRQKLKRPVIREEGGRLGLDGNELDEFVEIIKGIDMLEWFALLQRKAKEAAEAAKNAPPKG